MKFLNNLDLQSNEIQNVVIQNYAGNPDTALTGTIGQIVYSTTTSSLFVNTNGATAWSELGTVGGFVTSITAGNAISVTGTATVPVINHADTSSQASVDNSLNNFIQDVTLDTYGHVTGLTSAAVDVYGGWTASDGSNSENIAEGDSVIFSGGGATTVSYSTVSNTFTISSTDNNTTYTAGTALDLTGTVFSLSHLGFEDLADPLADRVAFWDASAGAFEWLTMGTNLTISDTTLNATDTNTITNAFSTIAVSGQTNVVADSTADTLTLAAGANVTITTNGTTDTITIASTDTNDNDIDYINAASFVSGTLNLTGVGNAGASVSLDGRYLQSYTETDTLDSVVGRGATTATAITVGGLTVNGDLTVSGAHTVKLAEEVQIEDSLIVLNINEAGAPSEDAGFVVERGSEGNVAFIWDESADQFAVISTAETGTTAGDVTIADYADIHVGALFTDDAATVGGTLILNSVVNAGVDTDKFLVLDATGNVDFRTGAEVLSDIGAQASFSAGTYIEDFTIAADSGTSNTIVDGETFTIAGGGDVTTAVTANTVTVSFTETYTAHENISAATSINGSGIDFIQDVTVDGNGHVTGLANATIRNATTTLKGVVELATNSEASAGTASTVITASNLPSAFASQNHISIISGDASTTSFAITHNLNTFDVLVQVIDYGNAGTGATYETVFPDVSRSDANTVTVAFGKAPTATEDYRVLVHKVG